MERLQCTNCGASLPPTGTYCLACDTPVSGAERGLSVAETRVVQTGNAWVVYSVVAAVLIVLVGSGWLTMRLWHHHVDGSAAAAATKGVYYLVRAEGGHDKSCTYVANDLRGQHDTLLTRCEAILGDDPGATLKRLHETAVHRHGHHGTVDLRGTLVDHTGRRVFTTTATVVEADNGWWLDWDGKPLAARS